jgi:colicin import membrane protein
MPTGIVMQSSSVGATQEAIEKVLVANGLEPNKPEVQVETPVEPKPEDFESDEEFETAQEEFTTAQEEAEAEAERLEEEKAAEKKPKLTRSQRIAARATRELQEQLKKANERLAALEGGSGKKEAKVEAPKAPKREEFKTDEEFEDAKFDYRYKLRRAKEEAENQLNSQQERLKTNFENYQSSVAEFKETHEDWDEVVDQPIPVQESVYFAIHELENGPAVLPRETPSRRQKTS